MVKRLLYLNGLAILSAVLYHASAWGFISMFWWTDRYRPVAVPNFDQLGGLTYYALRFVEQAIIFAIPSFLVVSGFFTSAATGRGQSTIRWRLVLSRITTLVIPFLLWSILILVVKMLQGERHTIEQAVVILLTGKIEPPYYYVPVLVQLYLLAPFLVPLARHRWKLLLGIAGLVQLGVLILRYPMILGFKLAALAPFYFLTTGWLFPGYIFWFSFGIVAGFHMSQFKQALDRYKWAFLLGVIVFLVAGIVEWEHLLRLSGQAWIGPTETLVDSLYAGAFVLSFLAFEPFVPPLSSHLASIGSKSYGIYLIHSPVLEYAARAIYHFAPLIMTYQIVFQPILWVTGLGVPLALMTVVNNSPGQRLYGYLFG